MESAGNYRGDDEIGRLISDFNQTNADDMRYNELAEGVRHFKDTEKGRGVMCESVERYGDEREATGKMAGTINAVRKLMKNMKLTMEQALDALGISGDERDEILKQLNEHADRR